MCLYRAYDQPGKRNARLRIPTFVSQNELFSPDLKSLCIENIQERIPPTPEDCPRCEAHLPRFVLQPGFKRGLAGAIIFVCMCCHKPHIPVQCGPSEGMLRVIEAQRDRDLHRRRARDAANQAVVQAKKGRAQGRLPAHMTVAAGLLFRNPVPDGRGGIKEGTVTRGHTVHDRGRGAKKITMILFYKDHEPSVSRTESMRDKHSIMLADYPWILECCGAGHIYVFQYWHLVDQGWILIPFMTTAIGIEDDVDTIFLRVYGVKTISLALELRRYEDLHGLGLHPDDPLSKYISQDVVNHVWLVFWKEDRSPPELLSMVLQGGVRPSSAALFGEQPISYWVESEARWEAFPVRGEPLKLKKDANAVLLRRTRVRHLLGFGDALESLERYRSARSANLRERRVTHADGISTGARGATLPDVLPIVYENGVEVIDISEL